MDNQTITNTTFQLTLTHEQGLALLSLVENRISEMYENGNTPAQIVKMAQIEYDLVRVVCADDCK